MTNSPPKASLLNMNKLDILGSVLSGGFDMKQLINDPRDIAILCQRAQLPSWNISTFEYQSDRQVNKYPYTYIHEDLTKYRVYFIRSVGRVWIR